MLLEPSYCPEAIEQMDETDVSVGELIKVERALNKINFFSGSFNRTANWLLKEYKRHLSTSSKTFSFLDIGCGGGGLLRYLEKFSIRYALNIAFHGTELNDRLLTIAESESDSESKIKYSSKPIDENKERYSLVYSNLVLHHILPQQLDSFLEISKEKATISVRHEDVLRSWKGVVLANIFPRMITLSSIVHHDSIASIYRALSKNEWIEKTTVNGYRYKFVFPERIQLQTDLCR